MSVAKHKVAICIPNMILGGVESVFCRTLDELLTISDLEIIVLTHAKIKEPLYLDWFKAHPETHVYNYYPLQDIFERIKEYTNFPIIKTIRKLLFGAYKAYRRLFMRCVVNLKDIDVFIDYKTCCFYKELRRFTSKRKVVWIHGNVEYIQNNGRGKHLEIYDRIIGLTDEFVDAFRAAYPQYSKRVVRIYNPINIDQIKSLAATGARAPYENYFIHISRLDSDQKDLLTLIRAFNNFYIDNYRPDVHLVIVGTGPRERMLRKLASGLPCANNITFTGGLFNPYAYMSGAMANILSSNYEGLPTVLIEGQALGVLNISSDCKYGPREILENGKSGLLFPVGDADALSALMSDVYNNKIDVATMIENGRKAVSRFSPEIIKEQIQGLLK